MNNNEKVGLGKKVGDVGISEMAIVDTFTKLIFGEERDYSAEELQIIDAFSIAEFGVPSQDHAELGEMLRELGVRQMIDLVVRVRDVLAMPAAMMQNSQHGAAQGSATH